MDTLLDLLDLKLRTESSVSLETFRAIIWKLYSTGILLRDESDAVDTRLYDAAERTENLLHEYFGLAGFTLQRPETAQYFRLYPPEDPAERGEPGSPGGLRQRLTGDLASYLLVLRHLYQLGVDGGTVNDRGEITTSLPELRQAMLLLLKRDVPQVKSARQKVYDQLRYQKLARFPDSYREEPDDMEFLIRPPIEDFVRPSQLRTVREEAHWGRDSSASAGAAPSAGASSAVLAEALVLPDSAQPGEDE